MLRRPLGRSLDPLPEEDLGGFLLRLSAHLSMPPIALAKHIGLVKPPKSTLGRKLLFLEDLDGFAHMTRLQAQAARALTLVDWRERYPPIGRFIASFSAPRSSYVDLWLLTVTPRHCPACLAGEASEVHRRYGGAWKRLWRLPVTFACLSHGTLLREDCGLDHAIRPGSPLLIASSATSALHPAQCRQPRPGQHGYGSIPCGNRLDQPLRTVAARASRSQLDAQRRILEHFDPATALPDAARFFTDLRLIAALITAAWPAAQHLAEPDGHALITEHASSLLSLNRRAVDKPPATVAGTSALLTAAVSVLGNPGHVVELAECLRASRNTRPTQATWTDAFIRHSPACSPDLRHAFEPLSFSFRRASGPHSKRAPTRPRGYRPEHVPAFLEQSWYLEHLAPLRCEPCIRAARRFAAVTLVQWAAGGSTADAANYLGINPGGRNQYAPTNDLYKRLAEIGQDRFDQALRDLARKLDGMASLIDYRERREALAGWSLTTDQWQEIVGRLPPVPGPVQPILDDRRRQEASVAIWTHITRGDPRFAPRPIEAEQPPPAQRHWRKMRSATDYQLHRPDPLRHYAALRTLLQEHANRLVSAIDRGTSTAW